ncbi:hypothetical protein [Pseudalkalibacillus hwajinpoensis]|uniref:hypothetical protein n=1 Tax=Guptibacillus hwajinpoensis TaxID=208199 RepID=UPI001CD4D070|nr:hypothetical protein [Pseudalkalibacillus hwajinpoensis]MCA0991418.1 hypothetical protein [Pseudalkalibacillus hwajinpoensis]
MSYTLSAEEYILSLLLIDGVQAAASIKEEVFEDISDQELETRLDSATNGLLSKGLLTIDKNEENVDEAFENFLMKLTNTPRVIRCQIATDTAMLTTSLFCNDDYTVQQSLYDNRVVKLFPENNEKKLSQLMDLSDVKVNLEPFSIKEPLFEKVIDKLLANKELTSEESNLFPPEFLQVLKQKQGKLNALYDYYLDEQVMIGSLLYITGNGQTWSIESEGEILTIAPFSYKSLFE